MNKILVVFGTRPELIKLAPVIHEFRNRGQRNKLYIVNSNQHKDLHQEDLDYFKMDTDYRFELSRTSDSLSLLNGLLLLEFTKLKSTLDTQNIHLEAVIAQGDTCTTFSAAQFAFYKGIPFIHIEAGLRTADFQHPFPEEFFRKTISSIASLHFAPTPGAAQNLEEEGISSDSIHITGNTVIDNLRIYSETNNFTSDSTTERPLILITIHRRENIKANMPAIIDQIGVFCQEHPEKNFVWIDNPGYKISSRVRIQAKNFRIISPVSY
ncbi:MAG TPA: UDP-N-acetylglucosamine 2-epimerase, partial [Bacteroidia bacterium]|nr:UDP-N-acetylglucosamine 2-epimerase [Bacteroidia bacterium]